MGLDIPASFLLPTAGNLAGQEAGSGTAENRTYLARDGSDPLGAVVRSESRFQGVSRGEGRQ